MTKPKKKPKTGDVVGWAVVNKVNQVYETYETRSHARKGLERMQIWGAVKPYRIAKVVLAK